MAEKFLSATLPLFLCLSFAHAQGTKSVEGIPISDELTVSKCGGCHQRDSAGMMRRLSYIRTTPEVWEEAIKRMVRLNGLALQPGEAKQILRYLSVNNGLAPEEAKPIFWEAEHRLFRDQSDKIPADQLQHTCNYCHTIGRVLGQRRTRDDYEKLISMHLGMFPGAENTMRPRRSSLPQPEPPSQYAAPTGAMPTVVPRVETALNGVKPETRYPADIAIDYLAKAQPLITPEWVSWKAAMHQPKLQGKWLLTGYQSGRGRVFGTVVIEPGATPEEFLTKTEIEYPGSGIKLSRTGKGIVYTGYSWRGRSVPSTTAGTASTADPNLNPSEWREALLVARDNNSIDGRWFWGGYQEFGIDAHLVRVEAAPLLAGSGALSLQSPSTSELRLYGANFPADLKPADFDLGSGITVKRIVGKSSSMATLEVQVASKMEPGLRDISLRHSTAEKAIAIYDKVAYIKVQPDASMARLGGVIAFKQFAQFEAVAYAAGPDGKLQTEDDIPLGPVSARWALEEFISTPGDDDVKFVGAINDNGMFTPQIEGPNPQRRKQANNYPTNNWGDVWVSASYDVPGGQPLKARSYLVVTIPVYQKWDQPEVGQ